MFQAALCCYVDLNLLLVLTCTCLMTYDGFCCSLYSVEAAAAAAAMTVNPLSASTDSPPHPPIMALSPRDPLNGFVGE